MESALRPREIQSRIRSGQSLDEVARVAGVPAERIEPYAAPVLAEREHVAGMALAASVRRRGEAAAHRSLRPVIREKLTGAGVDPDLVEWDAWRNEDKRWSIQARWEADGTPRSAVFFFDLAGRFSIAADDQARWLLSETPPAPRDAAAEDAAEADELALVRVVEGANEEPADPDNEPTVSLAEPAEDSASAPADRGEEDWFPSSASTPQEIREQVEAEIDAYGLVPEGRSELDVLYDMLGGLAEDSINIYAGLSAPVVPTTPDPAPEPVSEPARPVGRAVPPPVAPPAATDQEQPEPTGSQPEGAVSRPDEADEADEAEDPDLTAPRPAPVDPDLTRPRPHAGAPNAHDDSQNEPTVVRKLPPRPAAAAASGVGATEERPQQPLVGEPEETVPIRPGQAKRRGSKRKRASVPSWDEIVFGSPKPE